MRDWHAFVRERLPVDDLSPAAGRRAVRELAAQLEDCYRDATARGVAEADDAPGAAVMGMLLMVAAVVLGVRMARNRLSILASRTPWPSACSSPRMRPMSRMR